MGRRLGHAEEGLEHRLLAPSALERNGGAFDELDRHLAAARSEDAPALALGLAARLAMIAGALSGKIEPHEVDAKPDEALTIDQAAQRLGISKDYLYRHDLPFKVRIGRRVLFSARGLARWLNEQRTRPR